MSRRPRVLAAAAALALAAATPHVAPAQVTFFSDPAAFAAAATTTLEATFDGLGEGTIAGSLTLGRVTITPPGPFTLYVATPGGAAEPFFAPGVRPLASDVLTAAGNERFDLTFSGGAPTAVSLLVLPNSFGGPTVRVFDLADALLGAFTLDAPGGVRFLGLTSALPIGRVQYEAVGGQTEDTGIDDVRVGRAVSAVPEPATLSLLAAGLVAALGARARRRA